MSNFAQVKSNDFVLDPFVGTGSMLIPPSYFGYEFNKVIKFTSMLLYIY